MPIIPLGGKRILTPVLGRSWQRAAGGVTSYPVIEDVTRQTFGSNSQNHLVTMPATVNAGDLLLTLFSCDGGGDTIDTPTNWTQIIQDNQASGFGCFVKKAAGNEDGTNVDFYTPISAETGCSHTYRMRTGTWGGALTDVEASSSKGSGFNPDPPSLTATWGATLNLWLACLGHDDGNDVNTYPTDFSNGIYDKSGALTTHCTVASCTREYNTSDTLDPGTFTINGAYGYVVFTIVIKPHGL